MGFIFDEFDHNMRTFEPNIIEILTHFNMESIILEDVENIDFITSNIG